MRAQVGALQADLLSAYWPAPWGPCATDGSYPTTDDARRIVEYGLRHGWLPTIRGGTFVLSEQEHAGFSLEHFLLTDRLRTESATDPTEQVIRAYDRRIAGCQSMCPVLGSTCARKLRMASSASRRLIVERSDLPTVKP